MLKCQVTWLYLEPIFTSEDIIAQMPVEGRKFDIVDSNWKNIIAEAVGLSCYTASFLNLAHCFDFCFIILVQVKDARVLVATGQPNMLQRLQESNMLLEDIQKGLNTYLEKKRLYFPRF